MKIGDKITMYFYFMGVVSESEVKVVKFDDKTITTDDGDEGRVFDRKTGKCLNDNNFGGAYRSIDKNI